MFYNIDDRTSYVEVYGIKGQQSQIIDPHDIIRTRTVGYDNIHRGILGQVTYSQYYRSFCNFLNYRFDYFDRFLITIVSHPNMSENPYERYQKVLYQCVGQK